ncbi:hypothetical protein BH20VER2_BH20VER2_18820 [soil metagenome]
MRVSVALIACQVLVASVFCASAREAGTITWSAPVEIASGNGRRGPWQQNESNFDYVDDATVALSADGAAAVAWVQQRQKDVFFQVFDRAGKARPRQPVNVSRSPSVFSWLPRVALSPARADNVYVLWQEIVFSGGSHGGDIFFARSTDGGSSFSTPLNLSNSKAGDGKGRIDAERWDNGSLDLALAPDGTVLAAWSSYEGALWISRSTDGGATFSKPLHVAGDDRTPARGPALAVGEGSSVYLAWAVGEDTRGDVHFARSEDGGISFSAPLVVAETNGFSDAPKLAVSGDGTLHLVHGEGSGRNAAQQTVRSTRSRDGGRTFERTREISGRKAGALFPSISVGAASDVFVLWEIPVGQRRTRGLGIVRSSDSGNSFSASAVVPGSIDPAARTNGNQQGFLMRKLAVNATGSIAVVNSSFTPNEKSRVWLMRGEAQPRQP